MCAAGVSACCEVCCVANSGIVAGGDPRLAAVDVANSGIAGVAGVSTGISSAVDCCESVSASSSRTAKSPVLLNLENINQNCNMWMDTHEIVHCIPPQLLSAVFVFVFTQMAAPHKWVILRPLTDTTK